MSQVIKTKKGLMHAYRACPAQVQAYFEHLPRLVDDFPLDVALAYSFSRLELGQNMALYCGAVKLFRANAEIARKAVGTHHMTRSDFVKLYKTVLAVDLPADAAAALKTAEDARDDVMHGKPVLVGDLRNAIARVLEYASAVNAQLHAKHRFRPFGALNGFAGAARKLDKQTTRFMLKGMGFDLA